MDVESVKANCEANAGIAGFGYSGLSSSTLDMHLKRSSQDFEGTISGLGSTQLLTSWAITIAGTQAYPDSFEDPHAILAALLSLLASTTQAVPLWSGVLREKPWIQKFRQSLHGIHMIVFLGSFIGRSGAKTAESTPPVVVWSVTTITVLSVFWNLGLTLVVVFRRTKKRAMKRSDKTTAAVIGYLALVPTLYLISLVFYMKFGSKACPLNSSEDNAWSYGQFLAILMAAAPFVAAVEDFINLKAANQDSSPEGQELSTLPLPASNRVNDKSDKTT